jgi:hypothetical protein
MVMGAYSKNPASAPFRRPLQTPLAPLPDTVGADFVPRRGPVFVRALPSPRPAPYIGLAVREGGYGDKLASE